jgi:hypothetical protein
VAEPLLTDGQYAGLLTSIVAGLGGIAAAVRWGLGRGAKAFDEMAAAFTSMANEHRTTRETLIELRAEVREGRSDIGEIKAAIVLALEGSRRTSTKRTPPLGTTPRRAATDSDR